MPKLPKLSELTDVSGMMNKMKSALDNLTGPSNSSATEDALAQESDPIKAKFLEVELLINQLHDLTVIQNKTISELKAKYAEVKTIASEAMAPAPKDEVAEPAAKAPTVPLTPAPKTEAKEAETPKKEDSE